MEIFRFDTTSLEATVLLMLLNRRELIGPENLKSIKKKFYLGFGTPKLEHYLFVRSY